MAFVILEPRLCYVSELIDLHSCTYCIILPIPSGPFATIITPRRFTRYNLNDSKYGGENLREGKSTNPEGSKNILIIIA